MKLVSLELSAKDAKEEEGCAPTPADLPKYPYGTCLYLDEDEQAKLGIKDMPDVGTEFPMQAVVKVVGTSQRETQGGIRKTLDIQITKMGLGITDDSPMDQAAKKLYPNQS